MSYTARVYKIINVINDDIYIGSTKQTLEKRLYEHRLRSTYKKYQHRDFYAFLYKHRVNPRTFEIILLEEFLCENRRHQLKREQYFITTLKPKFNMTNCSRD